MLLVDDEAHARTYLRMVLRGLGVTTVWEVGNGRDALELFTQHRPTVVFMDNNMPVMSGKKTIDALRAIDAEVVIVVVTADNDLETVKFYLEHGANAYVLKHNDRSSVTAIIAEVFAGIEVQHCSSAVCASSA